MSALAGRVAVVTGGGQGIGKGVTRQLLNAGMRVVIAEIDAEAGEETAAEYARYGDLRYVPTDTASEAQVARMVTETVAVWGGIDLLVNNAGIGAGMGTPPTELSLDTWMRVLQVNLTGYFLCAKHAAPYVRERRGSIINIASTRALMSEPNTEAYAASKGGVVALTHALAVSLGPDVRVNCISPGWIEVGPWKKAPERREARHSEADRLQHPAGRVGTPDDIARAICYLADPANDFITGANIIIDGGMTRKMIYVE